jgi:hypothetical protein
LPFLLISDEDLLTAHRCASFQQGPEPSALMRRPISRQVQAQCVEAFVSASSAVKEASRSRPTPRAEVEAGCAAAAAALEASVRDGLWRLLRGSDGGRTTRGGTGGQAPLGGRYAEEQALEARALAATDPLEVRPLSRCALCRSLCTPSCEHQTRRFLRSFLRSFWVCAAAAGALSVARPLRCPPRRRPRCQSRRLPQPLLAGRRRRRSPRQASARGRPQQRGVGSRRGGRRRNGARGGRCRGLGAVRGRVGAGGRGTSGGAGAATCPARCST